MHRETGSEEGHLSGSVEMGHMARWIREAAWLCMAFIVLSAVAIRVCRARLIEFVNEALSGLD